MGSRRIIISVIFLTLSFAVSAEETTPILSPEPIATPSASPLPEASPSPSTSPSPEVSPSPSASPTPEEPPPPPTPILSKPFSVYIGGIASQETLNATDLSNGGQAALTGMGAGFRIGVIRPLYKYEHRLEFQYTQIIFPAITSTRLTDLTQNSFQGLHWEIRSISPSFIGLLGGVQFDTIPYLSTLSVTTIKLDGTMSVLPYAGVLFKFGGILQSVGLHVGYEMPMGGTNYTPSGGLWERARVTGNIPLGTSGVKSIDILLEVGSYGEKTNLETQSHMSMACTALFKWQFLPAPGSVAAETLACLLYTSPSPRDGLLSRMPSSA